MAEDQYTGIKSDQYTYFTQPGPTQLLLSLPSWSLVTLRLESPGPVAIGTREDLSPVGSGKGRLLPVDEDVKVVMVPLTRLYVVSNSVQRISVMAEPYPWLFELLTAIRKTPVVLGSVLQKLLTGGRR